MSKSSELQVFTGFPIWQITVMIPLDMHCFPICSGGNISLPWLKLPVAIHISAILTFYNRQQRNNSIWFIFYLHRYFIGDMCFYSVITAVTWWCWVLPVWRSCEYFFSGPGFNSTHPMNNSSCMHIIDNTVISNSRFIIIVIFFITPVFCRPCESNCFSFCLLFVFASCFFLFICKAFLLEIVLLSILLLAILALYVSISIPMLYQFKMFL